MPSPSAPRLFAARLTLSLCTASLLASLCLLAPPRARAADSVKEPSDEPCHPRP